MLPPTATGSGIQPSRVRPIQQPQKQLRDNDDARIEDTKRDPSETRSYVDLATRWHAGRRRGRGTVHHGVLEEKQEIQYTSAFPLWRPEQATLASESYQSSPRDSGKGVRESVVSSFQQGWKRSCDCPH